MTPDDPLDRLIAAFAQPAQRRAAAEEFARHLGGDELLMFASDPELGIFVPAPGFQQPLSDPPAWREFLTGCSAAGELVGRVPTEEGTAPAHGIAVSGAIAVLVGEGAPRADLGPLRPALTLFGTLFRDENRADAAEAEASAAKEAAETADRAKSEFLASMSHELRTPINAIIGYTEILDMGIGGELSEEQRHHVDRVRGSSRHLLTLINDVLDLARIEAGHMTVEQLKWRVRPAIADALALLALQAEERTVHLVDECRDPELSYFGDQDRVRQILANLLSNAVKFTAADGSITVRCGSTDQPAPDAHLDADATWTFIQVEDTGVGMTAAEAATVFQPFVQAAAGRTRSHGGTGLGLTISRQLARLMGGDLTLRSEPGVGTCVTLWLSGQRARSGVLDESIRVNAV